MAYRMSTETSTTYWTVLEDLLAKGDHAGADDMARSVLEMSRHVQTPVELVGVCNQVRTELRYHIPSGDRVQRAVTDLENRRGKTLSEKGTGGNVMRAIVQKAADKLKRGYADMPVDILKEYKVRFLREDGYKMLERLPLSRTAHSRMIKMVNDDADETYKVIRNLLNTGSSDIAYSLIGVSERLFNYVVSKEGSVEGTIRSLLEIDTSRMVVMLIFIRAVSVAICAWAERMQVEDLAITLIRYMNIRHVSGLDVVIGTIMSNVVDRMVTNVGTTALVWMTIGDVIPHLTVSAVHFHLRRWTRDRRFINTLYGLGKDIRANMDSEDFANRFCTYHLRDLDGEKTEPIRFIVGALVTHICVLMNEVKEIQGSCAHSVGSIFYSDDIYNRMFTVIQEMERPSGVHQEVAIPERGWERRQLEGVQQLVGKVTKPFDVMQELYKYYMFQVKGQVDPEW